jgi:hypothetical protein
MAYLLVIKTDPPQDPGMEEFHDRRGISIVLEEIAMSLRTGPPYHGPYVSTWVDRKLVSITLTQFEEAVAG